MHCQSSVVDFIIAVTAQNEFNRLSNIDKQETTFTNASYLQNYTTSIHKLFYPFFDTCNTRINNVLSMNGISRGALLLWF